MDKSKEEILIEKYLSGEANEPERAMIESWYLKLGEEGEMPALSVIEEAETKVWNRLSVDQPRSKRISLWPRTIAAASVLIGVGLGAFFYKASFIDKQATKIDIAPGQNAATLVLSDGRKITLSNASNGKFAEDAGISISKTADGQLVYDLKSASASVNASKINTLYTARGQQYQVRLPDGTNVWLNAASSLSYLTSFKSSDQRIVELSGEAYFEVAKDKKHPFIVKANQQRVEVLGTHFNISSYKDETAVRTTLLEGSVKVLNLKSRASGVLKPGQQSVIRLSDDSLKVITVDTEETIAWKKGEFFFNEEPLESVMKKISRWYNVEVEFQDPSKKEVKFGGYISRFSHISKVLKMLELTGLAKFTVENNKVIIK
jgi:transmembrane sensor